MSEIPLLNPLISAPMTMTTVTPMATPRIVRAARILWARSDARAMPTPSHRAATATPGPPPTCDRAAPHGAAPRPQRLAQAELARPFRHRHEHDVHDHDAADHERHHHDAGQHHDEDATDPRPEPLHAFGRVQREVVVLARPQMATAAH